LTIVLPREMLNSKSEKHQVHLFLAHSVVLVQKSFNNYSKFFHVLYFVVETLVGLSVREVAVHKTSELQFRDLVRYC